MFAPVLWNSNINALVLRTLAWFINNLTQTISSVHVFFYAPINQLNIIADTHFKIKDDDLS